MTKRIICGVAVAATVSLAGCKGNNATAPSAPGSSAIAARGEPFEVTGVVTDDQGRPLEGIPVMMRHYLGGVIQAPFTMTDAAGVYTIAFTANPWTNSRGRGAARAEVNLFETHEVYHRTVFATGPHLVENIRLHPLQRFVPGDSVQLTITADDGECTGGLSWTLATVCRNVALTAQANGSIILEAISGGDAGGPLISVCCVSGEDRYGNPLSIPATAGTTFAVEIGLTGEFATPQPIVVKAAVTSS